MNIAIVTACQSGVATGFIAANLLNKASTNLGWKVTTECQSDIIAHSALSQSDITDADFIIVASDNPIDLQRFIGKRVYQTSINSVISNFNDLLNSAYSNAHVLCEDDVQIDESTPDNPKNIVAITACPTGVAHTFMAAEALENEAKKRGYSIKVETRGSVGAKNKLSTEEVAAADLVIVAADIDVPLDRFEGKNVYLTQTGAAVKRTSEVFDRALSEAAPYHGANTVQLKTSEEKKGIYQHLMNGVSHMLPMVVAGGLIIALSFVFGIQAFEEKGTLAASLMDIGGGAAFKLMIPVLSGFIAFSIADRPGLAPGLVGGMLASSIGAGFLGGIAAGFIAGYCAKLLAQKLSLPQSMEALKPILIIPFIATLLTGLTMIYIVGEPISSVMSLLTDFLNNMGTESAIFLGLVLGGMMCFDLGGPVNKTAYAFGVGLLTSQSYAPMAAIMAAGMVPALGMGAATFFAKHKFDDSEREAGKASFVLGLCFISEGAIPFAAKDPMRVLPSCILGGAVTGALSMLCGAKLVAPHGGLFVLLIPNAISPIGLYVLSIITGTVITGICYATLKTKKTLSNI